MSEIRELPDETDWISDGDATSKKIWSYNQDLDI